MLSPNQLVPHIFPVHANKKLEMCCAVRSVGTEVAVRNEAAPVFPLPCGAAVCRRLLKESGAGGAVGPCLSLPLCPVLC